MSEEPPAAPGPPSVERPGTTPFLRVLTPDTTAEEVAALVAVLASLGGAEVPARPPTPEWSANHRKVRATLPHGPGGWRSSGLPR